MSSKVVLVGHCGPDSSALRWAVASADRSIEVLSADTPQELDRAIAAGAQLLLVNRELSYGFQDGLGVDLIRRLRSQHPNLRMMLVSNYPDAQADAVAAGAIPGFGKRDIGSPKVAAQLQKALGSAGGG